SVVSGQWSVVSGQWSELMLESRDHWSRRSSWDCSGLHEPKHRRRIAGRMWRVLRRNRGGESGAEDYDGKHLLSASPQAACGTKGDHGWQCMEHS
ncbi:MAG: hypothetical protein ACREJB_02775, partial [Planctomycetaceae bacterium]